MLRLSKRLYLNHDRTKVVEHGDPDAAFLLGSAGTLVTEQDAKKYKLPTVEVDNEDLPAALVGRSQVAWFPTDPDDDSLYDDQSERGKKARADARKANMHPIEEYVLSTGGSKEEAKEAALEATGQASSPGPSVKDQQKENKALRGE